VYEQGGESGQPEPKKTRFYSQYGMAEGCQRSGDAAASRANRGQKLEVLVRARKETILAKPQSMQEGRWQKGAGVVKDGSKARWCVMGTN
jgi:hypothetical protein